MVDITAIRADWKCRGFSCGVWTDAPGQTWEDYTHTVDEVVMILEGDVEFEIGGQVLRLSVGEELLIPAGVLHSVRNLGKTTSRWLYATRLAVSHCRYLPTKTGETGRFQAGPVDTLDLLADL